MAAGQPPMLTFATLAAATGATYSTWDATKVVRILSPLSYYIITQVVAGVGTLVRLDNLALPPSGAAGGDLAGTYPNPTVAAIHETGGPTQLTFGTVTDGEYLKRSGSNIISGTPAGGGGTGSPWLKEVPSSPGTADDEFESTTLNAAWNFWDDTSATNRTMTAGTVDPYTALTGATTAPIYDLHTNGRRSWMRIQVSDSNHTGWMYKSWTAATNVFVWARLRMVPRTVIATQGIITLELHKSASGHPDANNRCYVGLLRDSTSGGARVFGDVIDGGAGGSDSAGPSTTGNNNPEYFGIHKVGSNITLYAGQDGNWTALRPTKTSVTWTPAIIAIRLQSAETNKPYLTFGIDFVREFGIATMPPF